MLRNTLFLAAALSNVVQVVAQAHGEDAQGTDMGPVGFLWPEDRPWEGSEDNKGPCGSNSAISNRTEFPIVGGSVALSIADDAWNVVFRIAYDDNPTSQSEFQPLITSDIPEIEAGHQCYRVPTNGISNSIAEGTNATIQMEYWSNDSGTDESFYACADITLVSTRNFDIQIPCFNVTSSEFEAPSSTPSNAPVAEPSETVVVVVADDGLTGGEKAGIAVGSILGAALIVGVAVFFAFRKKTTTQDAETAPNTSEIKGAPSISSQ